MNITLMNEMELPNLKISQFFSFYWYLYTFGTFILFNFNKVSVDAGSKKDSVFV